MTQKQTKIISLAEASQITGYNQDYLGQLARSGKLVATKIGRNWTTTKEALEALELADGANSTAHGKQIPVKVLGGGLPEVEAVDHQTTSEQTPEGSKARANNAKPVSVLGLPIVLSEKKHQRPSGNLNELRQRVEHLNLKNELALIKSAKPKTRKHGLAAMQMAAIVLALLFTGLFGWQAQQHFSLFEKVAAIPDFITHRFFYNQNSSPLVVNQPAAQGAATGQKTGMVLGEKITIERTAAGALVLDTEEIDRRVLFNLQQVIEIGR